MANTFTQIYIHLVFAVKGRENLIRKNMREEIYKYITGIVKEKNQKMIAINGMPDHIHILLGLKPDIALSNFVRDIKANSSGFINQKKWLPGKFHWQDGFGAFSYSHSQISTVANYIHHQEKHHAKTTFKEEYLKILRRFHIEFDPQYLYEWVE
ncbi:MAG: IS200/IS605 family transposase [Bacteroidota bacterium]